MGPDENKQWWGKLSGPESSKLQAPGPCSGTRPPRIPKGHYHPLRLSDGAQIEMFGLGSFLIEAR